MVICAFAGHRDVFQPGVASRLTAELEKLLQTDDAFLFLTGGMGEFDGLATRAVHAVKRRHPEKRITLALVLPYFSARLNAEPAYRVDYDEILLPAELEGVHYKAAIPFRNRLMVDRADLVIAYVYRDFGGAYETVRYAEKRGKPVVNLAETPK